MKISPMPTAQNTVTADAGTPAQHFQPRSLRMTTNATPVAMAPPADAGAHVPKDQNLITPASSEGDAVNDATEPLSPSFAALAKQRRQLQVREQQLKTREEALKAQPAQAGAIDQARLKSEPLAVLMEAGVTYEQLTEAIMAQQNGVSPEQYRALQAKVDALESGFDKRLQDRDAQQEQQTLAGMRREATQLVAEGDEYELIRENRAVPQVMRLIERLYKETGDVLDVSEACGLIEAELLKDTLRVAGLNKVKTHLGQTAAPQAPATQRQPQQMRTLSNRDTTQAPMNAKQRAMAAFYGQQIRK
jgi:hypothetical protein